MTADRRKFKELLLYISKQGEDDPALGAVKLNKLVYYCDFRAYAALGQSITGATYIRRQFGPVPQELTAARSELLSSKSAIVTRQQYHDYEQQRLVAWRQPDLTVFSTDELRLVDQVLSEFRWSTAVEISERSHQEIGWRAARDGEVIPYETAFISDEPLTDDDIRRGKQLAREHGWSA